MPYLQLTGAPGFLALVLLLACLGAVGQLRVEESLERLEVKCRKGDERACEKVERIRDERVQLDSLEKQAVAFQTRSSELGIQTDNVPDLGKAYPLVVNDYFASDAVLDSHGKSELQERLFASCSEHFRHFWINPRRAWPTTTSGDPDWELIYVLIVDHYVGFCAR